MERDEFNRISVALRDWAESRPVIRKVWIFGSRVKGTNSPKSDLDVAIEFDLAGNETSLDAVWIFERVKWQAEIKNRMHEYSIDLLWHHAGAPNVQAGVREASRLIYERSRPMVTGDPA